MTIDGGNKNVKKQRELAEKNICQKLSHFFPNGFFSSHNPRKGIEFVPFEVRKRSVLGQTEVSDVV